MLDLIRLDSDKKKIELTKALYLKSFPREERAPFLLMKETARKRKADFWLIYDDEQYVGFVYVISGDTAAYIFYLAIDERFQGNGYGSNTLQLLKEKYEGRKVFLALEPLDESAPNNEQRIRRHDFYEKNGYFLLPGYIVEGGVRFQVRGHGGIISSSEYNSMMKNYAGPLYRAIYKMVFEE